MADAKLRTVPVRDSLERMQEYANSEKLYRLAVKENAKGKFSADFVRSWKHRRDAAYRDYTDPFGTRTFA